MLPDTSTTLFRVITCYAPKIGQPTGMCGQDGLLSQSSLIHDRPFSVVFTPMDRPL